MQSEQISPMVIASLENSTNAMHVPKHADTETQIILYDLASETGTCFSPAVWRVRLLLNYKRISYRTVWVEFPDIERVLQELGIRPAENSKGPKYTVPAIHHVPTGTYVMDSVAITKFVEENYPDRPVVLASPLGEDIEKKARGVLGKAMSTSIIPRELGLLSPRAQEYFRRTREAALGQALESLLEREEQTWAAVEEDATAVGQLILTNKERGPFILGKEVSVTDFFVAGALRNAKVVDEEIWRRVMKWPGYRQIYEACEEWMEKSD